MKAGDGNGAASSTVRYRYRTTVLLGTWKCSFEEAARDAVRAGQAEADEAGGYGIRWRVNGEVEEESVVRPALEAPGRVRPPA